MIRLPSFPYTPVLGWSSTRAEIFRTCRRRYFYQYYAKYDREIPMGRILHLKTLSSIPMTIGTGVHDILATVLTRLQKSSRELDEARLDQHVETSVQNLLNGIKLQEVYYKERPAPSLEELLEPIRECLSSFLASERYGWVRKNIHGNADCLIEPPGYGETRLRGMKIYSKVDFLFQLRGETVILDWKTGRPDPAKHRRQMLAYAAWAENNLDAPAGSIRCILAYLQPGYEEIEAVPTEAELDALAAEVSADIQQMKALCRDPEQNVPVEKEQFPMTERLGYCRHCQYRKLCDRVDVG